jgi:hypothetical protein
VHLLFFVVKKESFEKVRRYANKNDEKEKEKKKITEKKPK